MLDCLELAWEWDWFHLWDEGAFDYETEVYLLIGVWMRMTMIFYSWYFLMVKRVKWT